jgi:hypothetical protein
MKYLRTVMISLDGSEQLEKLPNNLLMDFSTIPEVLG